MGGGGGGKVKRGGCAGCLTRTPYATLIALIMCWAGSAVFCGTMYRGVNITLRLLQDVFHVDRGIQWVEPVQLAFVILGASMAAIGLMILVSSFLATGATRTEVYQSHIGRVAGRVSTAVFIFLIYILLVTWLGVLFCCIIVTIFYSLSWGICSTDEIQWNDGKIDFYPFSFLFPEGHQRVNMEVEGEREIKIFCIDSVQNAELYFVIATTACVLVIMSLVHFLMALSANYAHIRGHDKFTDFVDLHNIDMTSESVQLTEVDNNKYGSAHMGIQEYTM